MMTPPNAACQSVREQLLDACYDLLEPAAAQAVHEHLTGCAACRSCQAELAQAAAALRHDWAPPPPPGLAERALRRVLAERHRPWLARWRPPALSWERLAVAATLAVVVASLLLPRLAPPLPAPDSAAQQRELCFRYLGQLLADEAPGARLLVITRPGEGDLVEYLRAGTAGRLVIAGWTQPRGGLAPLPAALDTAPGMPPPLVLTTLRPQCDDRAAARWIVYTPSAAAAQAALATRCTWAAVCPRPDSPSPAASPATLDQAFRQQFLLLRPPPPPPPTGEAP
jgi:hypothetical protein